MLKARWPMLATAAALAVLVAWSFSERWTVLASSPFPLGVDGYFYPLEVRSLLEHGTLAYPASPLAFWWMAPFAALTDPITGAKLGAALGGALIALPAYGVGARLGRHRAAGIVAAVVATSSAGSAYLSIEFVKQGLGLTVALAAVWAALRAAQRPSRGRLAAAGGALVAALLAHKLAGGLAVTIAAAVALEEARGRGALRGRRLLYLVAALTGTAVVLVVLGAVAPQRFASPADLALVRGALTTHLRWDGAALALPHFVLAFDHEAAIGAVVALAAIGTLGGLARSTRAPSSLPGAFVLARGTAGAHGARAAAWTFIALALVLGLPCLDVTDPQGLALRLRVTAFVPLAMCAAIVAGELAARWAKFAVPALYIIASVLAFGLPRDRSEGIVVAHPALVAASLALADHVPTGATVIVPERHVEYMIAWYTRAPVSARPEQVPYPRRVRVVLPMSSAATGFPLGDTLDAARAAPDVDPPIGLHPRHRDGFVLVTEPTWDWVLAHLPERSRRHWAAWPTI